MEFTLTFYSKTEEDRGVYFNTKTGEEIEIIELLKN
jgi:hypothetical protein